eukprot:4663075-Amphidinium_carterae.1
MVGAVARDVHPLPEAPARCHHHELILKTCLIAQWAVEPVGVTCLDCAFAPIGILGSCKVFGLGTPFWVEWLLWEFSSCQAHVL